MRNRSETTSAGDGAISVCRSRTASRSYQRSGLLIEAIERLGGVEVLRIEIDDRPVGLDRALRIAELAVVDLTEHEQHLLLLGRRRRQLGLLGVDVLEIAPAPEADVEPLELVERRAVGVVDGEHVPEHLRSRSRDSRGPLRRAAPRGSRAPSFRRRRRRSPPCAGAAATRFGVVAAAQVELLERVGRLEIARPDLQRRAVGGRRLPIVAQVDLAEARDLVIERVLALGIGDAGRRAARSERPDRPACRARAPAARRRSAPRGAADPRRSARASAS